MRLRPDGLGARTLRVAPSELTGQPGVVADPLSPEAHSAIAAIEAALDVHELGADPGIVPRPWSQLAVAVQESELLRDVADYAAQGAQLPELLAELHATYVHDPKHRRDALAALVCTYRSAAWVCKNLGVRGLPQLAARAAKECAEQLGDPEWIGFADYLRGIMSGPLGRAHQYSLSIRSIDQLRGSLDNPNAVQVAGTLHLNAALACAAQGDADRTRDHLAEADTLAETLPPTPENFGGLHFGGANVSLWRVSLSTELGEGGKVAEIARDARPEDVPLLGWQACFYADLGRALAQERETREQGLRALIKAESLAPQWTRNNAFIRETVINLLSSARREAGGRDLRGLAYRMGVAPAG